MVLDVWYLVVPHAARTVQVDLPRVFVSLRLLQPEHAVCASHSHVRVAAWEPDGQRDVLRVHVVVVAKEQPLHGQSRGGFRDILCR